MPDRTTRRHCSPCCTNGIWPVLATVPRIDPMSGPIVQEFDTYAAYRAALLDAIGRAEREILIFDPDLGETGLESPHAAEALQRFLLHASGRDCLRAVLADTTRLDRNSPRLLRLLGSYGHKFAVRIVSH